ncbi:MAG: hypothetical protein HRT87_05775 [Legionellales bacterium]|nr:hypothetical protein [Legionellales bacterium]
MQKLQLISLLYIFILFGFLADSYTTKAWDRTYIQSGYGGDYKVTTKQKRSTFTFSDSSSWSLGENYFFVEAADYFHDEMILSGEFDPSFSLGKIFKQKIGAGPISDTLITARFYSDELGSREIDYGLAWYWDVHRIFKYVSTKLLYRKVLSIPGEAFAVQLISHINIHRYLFGTIFADWTINDQSLQYSRGKNFFGRVELFGDISILFNKLYCMYLGGGFSYWRNKLGIPGKHERVLYGALRIYI